MGVPALFRWLSKKYPKIIYPVEEEEEIKVPDEAGDNVAIPVSMSGPNPNGTEFDNLYLDMNGIVHPCTHPEGKPAPETEEDMMLEVFAYTERVVNMVRPRKLLFMAIDGVAPRAKMNQQRSRRFRAAQEAQDKEDARKESVAMWESMGKTVSDDEKTKEAWDSNAITPGTPFMDLLASSLRYWVVQKMNTDPGWKGIQVIISDAGVPGEGEHKIMDYIRRQRTNPGHDPNTRHVIYGLDADLIMLALATHEPHFRVLREDVFFNQGSSTACRMCGQEGHYAAQCTGTKAEIAKKPTPPEKKPFIFLDVSVLREYLEVELNVDAAPFPFSLEQALDDWVLLIFFVGNDFLPHLPSLEIREGAIDTLLKIWKQELPRMGGYLTNHGELEMSRAQIILDGLAMREDEIFRRRREAEERQDQNTKRRKLENLRAGPAPSLQLTVPPTAPGNNPVHPSLPARPVQDFAAAANSIGFGAQTTPAPPPAQNIAAQQALAGSNRDVVANRRAIRMANLSAAEVLKAELSGTSVPAVKKTTKILSPSSTIAESNMTMDTDEEVPGFGTTDSSVNVFMKNNSAEPSDTDADGEADPDALVVTTVDDDVKSNTSSMVGVKRKAPEDDATGEDSADVTVADDDDDEPPQEVAALALKVNTDGTVEQEDTVKLWEPGYKERYYRQKFGVETQDTEFRKSLTKSYIEGLAWVLQYYYQGTPSWQWYYPHHFAPFAADFLEVTKMDITFEIGAPFKPFEQLMGVFPAASRNNIPSAFHELMTQEESPIIDFYPPTFEVDMNGKKMVWQGVALLPFIDPVRLLAAMAVHYPNLTEEEIKRNRWGNNVVFASDEHLLYPFYEQLYGKRKKQEPVPLDTRLSGGMSGTVLPNPDCLPGSTYESPLTKQGLGDIRNDRSLSVLYFFPKQLKPHQSVLLPGVQKEPRVLSHGDLENTRNGGQRGGRRGGHNRNNIDGGNRRGGGGGQGNYQRPQQGYGGNNYGNGQSNSGGYGYGGDRGGGGGDRGSPYGNNNSHGGGYSGYQAPAPYQHQQPPRHSYQPVYGGGYGGGAPAHTPQAYNNNPPPRGGYGGGQQYNNNSYAGTYSQAGYDPSGRAGAHPQTGGFYGSAPPTQGYGGYGGPPQNYPPPPPPNNNNNYGGYSRR